MLAFVNILGPGLDGRRFVRSTHLDGAGTAEVAFEGDTAITFDKRRSIEQRSDAGEVEFPRAIPGAIPGDPEEHTPDRVWIALNASLLARLAQALDDDMGEVVAIGIQRDHDAIAVVGAAGAGALMPVNSDGTDWERRWADRRAEFLSDWSDEFGDDATGGAA